MNVLEAMNLLGINERPQGLATLELVMARALEQTPRQHELLEEARRCLSADLAARSSAESRLTNIQPHPTREILLFDENRDAVMFGDDAAPELPVPFQAPLVDDSLWMGDDSVIFEGEAEMMSEFAAASPASSAEVAADAAPSVDEEAEISPVSPLRSETSISGEWQLMLESLEAEGLIKPEEGFSDALSAQMLALHDTSADLEVSPALVEVNPALVEVSGPIFAPLEPRGHRERPQNSALLETPLFSAPMLESPLLEPALPLKPQQSALLEIQLFAASALDTSEQSQVITFDESLLISHGRPLTGDLIEPIAGSRIAPTSPAAFNPESSNLAPKTLETLPSRKASEAMQLSIKAAAAQPSEQLGKQLTGRGSVVPYGDATRTERRTVTRAAAPRTYRDARESPTQVRRRRQPVAVWLLGVAALLGSAVFIAPNLAAQLRDQLLPRAVAPIKPRAGSAAKPSVRVVKPAAIRPAQTASSPAKTVKPASQTVAVKPSANQPRTVKPIANQTTVSKPRVSPAPRAAVAVTPAPRAVPAVNAGAPPLAAPRVIAPPSSVSSLPPVTRPEGFASAAVNKLASKPVAAVKPAAAPAKPVLRPVPSPSPAPAPVASIEYQDKPTADAATGDLPGGLSRQEFGRQFLNRKQFEVWQSQQLTVRFESFAKIPLETQILEADAFRAAVLTPTVRPTRPERP